MPHVRLVVCFILCGYLYSHEKQTQRRILMPRSVLHPYSPFVSGRAFSLVLFPVYSLRACLRYIERVHKQISFGKTSLLLSFSRFKDYDSLTISHPVYMHLDHFTLSVYTAQCSTPPSILHDAFCLVALHSEKRDMKANFSIVLFCPWQQTTLLLSVNVEENRQNFPLFQSA